MGNNTQKSLYCTKYLLLTDNTAFPAWEQCMAFHRWANQGLTDLYKMFDMDMGKLQTFIIHFSKKLRVIYISIYPYLTWLKAFDLDSSNIRKWSWDFQVDNIVFKILQGYIRDCKTITNEV